MISAAEGMLNPAASSSSLSGGFVSVEAEPRAAVAAASVVAVADAG